MLSTFCVILTRLDASAPPRTYLDPSALPPGCLVFRIGRASVSIRNCLGGPLGGPNGGSTKRRAPLGETLTRTRLTPTCELYTTVMTLKFLPLLLIPSN